MSDTNKRLYKEEGLLRPYYFQSGKKNPRWSDGISSEVYTSEFSKSFKEEIRERDNHICLLCHILEENEIKLYKQRLKVHHIDYNKKNSSHQNCVSVCLKCHNKTNFNRDYWKVFFQSLLRERYGYKYTENQGVIQDFIGIEQDGMPA